MSDTKNVEYALIVKTDTSYSCLPISLALSDIFSHIKPSYDSQNIHVAHVCITVLKKQRSWQKIGRQGCIRIDIRNSSFPLDPFLFCHIALQLYEKRT